MRALALCRSFPIVARERLLALFIYLFQNAEASRLSGFGSCTNHSDIRIMCAYVHADFRRDLGTRARVLTLGADMSPKPFVRLGRVSRSSVCVSVGLRLSSPPPSAPFFAPRSPTRKNNGSCNLLLLITEVIC